MIPQISKNAVRARIHKRIREKMMGTGERPRLNVYRSLNHIYAQLVDDLQCKTLVAASTNEGKKKGEKKTASGNLTETNSVVKAIVDSVQATGLTQVVFDPSERRK